MTNNTQFKTLLNTWLNQKKPMITPSTHASFTLIAENHLIPHFGKRKIGSITEQDIQSYISYLYDSGRLDKSGGLTVKTIRDVILVFRLAMEYAYKERAIPLLNWDLIEYPKELGVKKVVSLSKDQEQALIQCIYMNLNRADCTGNVRLRHCLPPSGKAAERHFVKSARARPTGGIPPPALQVVSKLSLIHI